MRFIVCIPFCNSYFSLNGYCTVVDARIKEVFFNFVLTEEKPAIFDSGLFFGLIFVFCIVLAYFLELKKPLTLYRTACLPTCAIDSVSGISLGHTWTQFCELPQLPMPPGCVI